MRPEIRRNDLNADTNGELQTDTNRTALLELMRLHIQALFTHDAAGNLLHVNDLSAADAPRFFLGRTGEGALIRFRHDVNANTRRELEAVIALDALDQPLNPSRYEAILSQSAPIKNTWLGPAFSFPSAFSTSSDAVLVTNENVGLLDPYLRGWMPDTQTCYPMLATVVDGHAVAVCGTVRRTNEACEAGVETAAEFRGRGHAVRVVTSWAQAVRASGLIPLYSTSWQNEASRAVARKLGLVQFGNDLHIT